MLERCGNCHSFLHTDDDTVQHVRFVGHLCEKCRLSEENPVARLRDGYYAFVAFSVDQISGPWGTRKAAEAAHKREWGKAWVLDAVEMTAV